MNENVKRGLSTVGIIILFCAVVTGLTVLILTATTEPAGANVKDERVSDCSLQEKKRACDGVTTTTSTTVAPTTTSTTEVPTTTTTVPAPEAELIPSVSIERVPAPEVDKPSSPTHLPAEIRFTG